MTDYLIVMAVVFAVNLLPAFGPPTAAVLVGLTLSFDLAPVALVACGAVAAAAGRFTLANLARLFRPRLSQERRHHLDAAERYLTSNRAKSVMGLGLFALSPVPSGQLFVAAGLMRVALAPLTAAFFAGRVVSYSIYVAGATAIEDTVGDEALESLTSPLGIALQLLALAGLVLLLRVPWADLLARRLGADEGAGGPESGRIAPPGSGRGS